MNRIALTFAAIGTLTLSACATVPGSVEVTRFVAPEAASRLGEGTIFVESSAPDGADSLSLMAYKSAVAAELRALGYTETARADARQVAMVSL